ncbi:hypothetical protein C7T94_08825 [Pedobacter yulinensis]|uniref:Uncharacterized protein n=1 Tax=Pedobacter yulinensis TaxID=2126353 RepID=A0A2T3HJW0_9SPHI|nr:SDR family NAD(P)-dependent oxidoreductase [Pedobacter yulinensis]PST82745.1 hypothetical protein C7T94_08825 [Pedobacter yulinensis]
MKQSDDNRFIPMTSINSGRGVAVGEDLYCLTNQIVNLVMLGKPDEKWVLIDAGMPKSGPDIIEAAAERFGKGNAPECIILTHGHFDHVGGLVHLLEHWPVPVYAHPDEFPFLNGSQDYPEPDPGVEGGMLAKISSIYPHEATNVAEVLKPLPEDGSVPHCAGWKWVSTPGHAPGHVSFFREADGVLISGDAVITVQQDEMYKVLVQKKEINGPPRYLTTDWEAAEISLQRLNALKPQVLVPGHGQVMSGQELQQALNHLAENFRELAVPAHGRYVEKKKRNLPPLLLWLLALLFCSCATWKPGRPGQARLGSKTFVIIGASSGFGRGVAEELGRLKANVVLASRREAPLQEVADTIRKYGGTALVVPTDISKPEDLLALQEKTLAAFKTVDVWINMAGVGAIGRFWEIPLAEQERVVDINLKGVIYGSHTAINLFRKQGYGVLINMGSVESFNPLAYHASYAATKGGIRHLSQAINHELRLSGNKDIEIVTIEPWAADTPFWQHAANYSGRTARMAAMDHPQKVVNAVLRASLRPRREIPVGWKAKATRIFHRITPHGSERFSANVAHRSQIKTAPPAPVTSGSAFKPMSTGTGVTGGVKARMKRENEAGKTKRE